MVIEDYNCAHPGKQGSDQLGFDQKTKTTYQNDHLQ